jgi:hypothetical protein
VRRFLLVVALLALAPTARADTQISGDLQITGQLGVGTQVPRARLEAQMDATDQYGLLVSSGNGAAMLSVDRQGKLGIGVTPSARVDVAGTGDSGSVGMWLRGGNSTSTTLSSQIVFGTSTGTYRHSIGTRHVSEQSFGNSIDFFLWDSTGQPEAVGTLNVLSLQAISTYSFVSTHILPFGSPDAELEVSNGVTTGGGRIIRAAETSPSSREWKTDIVHLDSAAFTAAEVDVRALRHARYRYKDAAGRGIGPVYRGLIYEDAPSSIKGPGNSLIQDYRLLNLEMALKAADAQIAELEGKIAALEAKKRGH